ncbi:solute carrier family 2, facilitated glucose transporter member 11-like isoform X1 [Python bivittatus]|uniref:Solute carrier family 2, facilitated glucose transporter member 11-like isoform X1 n=1 Tax=Python bivittatus TaxID=176946 RepID=A0A9F5J1L0_PYTBI|nr:solute carrier family 2, facilitated glucose transporter member 11-like isoform X1 [Python bivittatus]
MLYSEVCNRPGIEHSLNCFAQDVKRFINETWLKRHGAGLPQETLALMWSFIVSIYCLGGLLGCLWSGPLAMRYGKKKSLICSNFIIITGALLIGSSKMAKSFEMILVGRFLYGISAGLCLNVHGPYLGEISPKKFRGVATTSAAVFFSLGKALGQIMGLRDLLGTEVLWPLLLALCGFPALLQLLLLPFFPESPPYLLRQKKDTQACLKAMKDLWGEGHQQTEIEDMLKEMALPGSKNLSIWEVVKQPSLRWPLLIVILLIMGLQLSGLSAKVQMKGLAISTLPLTPVLHEMLLFDLEDSGGNLQKIYFYAFEVFRTARLEEAIIPYVTLGIGLCEFVSVILCSFIIDHLGRRILLWGGFGMMALTLALLILTLSLQDQSPWISYSSIALIFLFIIFYGIGPSGAIFSVMVEIFSPAARPSALALAGSVSWVGLFIIGLGFPFVVEALSYYCFLIFFGVLVGMGIFIYLFLPETKGRSILDITEDLNRIPLGKKVTLTALENNSPGSHSICTKL